MSSSNVCVLVTGGSGYIGLHVVNECLKAGFKVNTTTRSLTSDSAAPLHCLAKQYPDKLRLFEADLLQPGAFQDASREVEAVIHVATPVLLQQNKDSADQQIKPAVEGTINVLQTCLESSTIKTIVVTSSTATIKDVSRPQSYVFTEKDFTPVDSESTSIYAKAKILAEREVWDFHKKHPQFRMVTVHPCFVLGPDLEPEGFKLKYNKSNAGKDLLLGIIKGTNKNFDQIVAGVDVKDVALAHIRAVQLSQAEGRIILADRSISVAELTKHIISTLPELELEDSSIPIPDYCSYTYDNQKSKDKLGLNYRSIMDSITETLNQLKPFFRPLLEGAI